MSCRRWLSTFGRHPLTYETLKARCNTFRTQKTHSPTQIQDYIRANRNLQKTNRQLDSGLRFGTLGSTLGLDLNVSSTQLEQELWQFLQLYWKVAVASEDVVKTYISTAGKLDTSRMFSLVTENFKGSVMSKRQVAIGPVTTLVHMLLREHDFHGCFKLVRKTVKSDAFMQLRRRQFVRKIANTCVVSVGFGFSAAVAHTLVGSGMPFGWIHFLGQISDIWPIIPSSLLSGLGTFLSLKSLKTASLPRVQWRPHTSLFYRILHTEEALLVNKIVTYFEEYYEVNVKNFHLSLLRPGVNPNILSTHDYELSLPGASENSAPDEIRAAMEELSSHFRLELNQRKMMWRPLKEEKMFVDFWMNHGENYEWVEPDQDPAELAIFKQSNFK